MFVEKSAKKKANQRIFRVETVTLHPFFNIVF